MIRIAVTICALLVLALPASAAVYMDIQCDEARSEFTFNVEIFNQFYIEEDATGWEVLFEQSKVGTCDEPVEVMAVPLPDPLGWGFHTFTLPVPEANQYFKFTAKMRAPDGAIHPIITMRPPSFAFASCGEAVAVRGYLEDADYQGYLNVLPCPDSCETWVCAEGVDVSQVPAEQWQPFVGTGIPVEVFGQFVMYPMAGSPCLMGTGVRPIAEEACGPVATDRRTWGSLKAGYR